AELGALYNAFSQGLPNPLPALPIQYADYAVWQREWIEGEELKDQLVYWSNKLEGAPTLWTMPTDRPRPAVESYRGARLNALLPEELINRLDDLGRRHNATLFMVLLAAFYALIYRYSGQDDILVGSPIANRTRKELEGLIGFFVNTLILRGDLSGDPSFTELLSRVRETALGAYGNQDLPFEKLVEELQPERSPSHSPLYQASFMVQDAQDAVLDFAGLGVQLIEVDRGISRLDLFVSVEHMPQGSLLRLEYNTDLFDSPRMERLLSHYQNLLESIVAEPEGKVSLLPLLEVEERRQLLTKWNDTVADYPKSRCIHDLFEKQVAKNPNAPAVVFGEQTLSYAELNCRANRLANYLVKQGVGPETLVGLCVERSLEMVTGLLGVLKAGAAYVPLDPSYPAERLAFMLEDSHTPLLLTQRSLRDRLPGDAAKIVCLDDRALFDKESAENPSSGVAPENLAYVIYTSGSTGRPKGAMIRHQGLTNYLTWASACYPLAEGKGSPVHSSLSFDLTVTSLLPALLTGKTAWLLPESDGVDDLAESLRAHRDYALVKITPAHLELLNSQLSPDEVAGLTHSFVIGGEVLYPEQVALWREHAPKTRLINEYGPTETVVGCCVYECGGDEPLNGISSVPIGRPIANTQLYVLDSNLQPVPMGMPGELYIGGDGLARGYYNRPDLTAERFIPNPFSDEPGARLYRTGDLCRYLEDGNLEYFGRIDHQVKIRGYRIELGEIESVLRQHPAVRESIAIVREDTPGDKRLVAYMVAESSALPQAEAQQTQTEQVSDWQEMYETLYAGPNPEDDPIFNIKGWDSSFTGEAIPPEEMREWVEETVTRILASKPTRVIEVGCGTGLLLFRVAPHCAHYTGIDFATQALDYVGGVLGRMPGLRPKVKLQHRTADQFADIGPEGADTVVINSVIQYFPSADYLAGVLEKAVSALNGGGRIFIGDVRSYSLLEEFHSLIQLHRASPETPRQEVRRRAQQAIAQ
ncbi:MAG TPA: amino acid adenylation domain-containing protein, partial [Capsulimonadaceae bacterium]|nr:amino acid adenylation domain-containing protein [Capsulimonadaceae bacterium]